MCRIFKVGKFKEGWVKEGHEVPTYKVRDAYIQGSSR